MKFLFLPPPLLDFYCQPFFVQFFNFLVNCGKNYVFLFYQLGKKYAFSSLFSFPFNHFCSPIWPYFCHIFGGKTEKIYTPAILQYLAVILLGTRVGLEAIKHLLPSKSIIMSTIHMSESGITSSGTEAVVVEEVEGMTRLYKSNPIRFCLRPRWRIALFLILEFAKVYRLLMISHTTCCNFDSQTFILLKVFLVSMTILFSMTAPSFHLTLPSFSIV